MYALALVFFFFNDTATTEIYTLSLHDALPICEPVEPPLEGGAAREVPAAAEHVREPAPLPRVQQDEGDQEQGDRKSTRLNSSHANISYAVFCLKKKYTYLLFILLILYL